MRPHHLPSPDVRLTDGTFNAEQRYALIGTTDANEAAKKLANVMQTVTAQMQGIHRRNANLFQMHTRIN